MNETTVDLRTSENNPRRERGKKAYAVLGAFAVVGLASLPFISSLATTMPRWTEPSGQSATAITAEETQQPKKQKTPLAPNPFNSVAPEAASAIVLDMESGEVLYEHNAQTPRALASLTKLMTMLIVFEHGSEWDQITIDANALASEGDSGLFVGETWRLTDLASFTLVTSSNDGAEALAGKYGKARDFVQAMNTRAATLGLSSLVFYNPTGLDVDSSTSGAYGTARDVALLLHETYHANPESMSYTTKPEVNFVSLSGFPHEAKNTNVPLSSLTGIRASKTGYTDIAGGNLATLYDIGLGHEVVIVVLGSSIDGRFEDTQALYDATREYLRSGWYAYEIAETHASL